jgi:hypothetical protein
MLVKGVMPEAKRANFDLDAMLAEIPEDEAVCRAVPRILTQADIRRLIEESRRHQQPLSSGGSANEE